MLLRARGDHVIGVDLRNADVIADLATQEGCSKMVSDVKSLVGDRIDIVIANAGVNGTDALCYAVNYHGAIRTLEGLHALLVRSSSPRAVVTASLAAASPPDPSKLEALEAGKDPGPAARSGAAYVVSKHAIARWVRHTATQDHWIGQGILLNAIAPGLINTPMQAEAAKDESVQKLIRSIPIKRTAAAREVAEAFGYLTSEANSYMTGQIIYVDGGFDAQMRPQLV
jgi:NAD(P)-dependent dehydrogenase (short-subunit alcohol dehydrogenase family)